MRISDWSSDVCSSDLEAGRGGGPIDGGAGGHLVVGADGGAAGQRQGQRQRAEGADAHDASTSTVAVWPATSRTPLGTSSICTRTGMRCASRTQLKVGLTLGSRRSEEHTSELQSLMRISYAVFCLKK